MELFISNGRTDTPVGKGVPAREKAVGTLHRGRVLGLMMRKLLQL